MQSSRVLPFSYGALCALLAIACGSSNNSKPDGGGGIGGIGGIGGNTDAGLDRNLTGTSGTGGTGGTGGTTTLGYCTGIMPDVSAPDASCPSAYTVADFTTDPPQVFGTFGQAVWGGKYANAPLTDTIDLTTTRWNITGMVEALAGFGIYWQCSPDGMSPMSCTIDVSRYRGIELTLKGDVGPSGRMGLSLGRAENDTVPMPGIAGCGSCTRVDGGPDAGQMCNGPRALFDLPNDGQDHTIVLTWEMFTGGHPNDRLDPHQLTGSFFFFQPPAVPDGDGGLDGGDAAAIPDAAVDAPFDLDAALAQDAAPAQDAATDGAVDPDAATDAAPRAPSYLANISIDSIRLVCY